MDLSPVARRPRSASSEAIMRALTPGTRPNLVLRIGLCLAALPLVLSVVLWLRQGPYGSDLEIPLMAADRWTHGLAPYDQDTFLPYLYPPFLLPYLVPLLALPRAIVYGAWLVLSVWSILFAFRRLGMAPGFIVAALLWAPAMEGLATGNVQVALFTLFIAAFVPGSRQSPGATLPDAEEPASFATTRRGVNAALVAALKVAQVHPWLYALRRNRRTALIGAGVVAAAVLVTIPATGLAMYGDWLGQLARAAAPDSASRGNSVPVFVGPTIGFVVQAASLIAVFFVGRNDAGAWIGILMILGSPSLHDHGLLYLLPAMLAVRLEIAIAAAILVQTTTAAGIWLAVGLVAAALLASHRWRVLRETVGSPSAG